MTSQKNLLIQLDNDFKVIRPIHLNLRTGWYDRSRHGPNLCFAKNITVQHIQGRYRLNTKDNEADVQEFFFDMEWSKYYQNGTKIKTISKDIANQYFKNLKYAAKNLLRKILWHIPKNYVCVRISGTGLHFTFFLSGIKNEKQWESITQYFIGKSGLPNSKHAGRLVFGVEYDSTLSSDRKMAEFGSWNKLKKDFKQEVDYLHYNTFMTVDDFISCTDYPFCSNLTEVKYPSKYEAFPVPAKLLEESSCYDFAISKSSGDKLSNSANGSITIASKRNVIEFNGQIPINDPARIISATPYWNMLRNSEASWYERQFLVKFLRWGLNLSQKEILDLLDKYNAWSDYDIRITAFYVVKHFREGTAETKVKKPVRKETLVKYGLV